MAWTAPYTFSSSEVLTADKLNEQIRDNLMETMPARALTLGAMFFTASADGDDTTSSGNAIAERIAQGQRVGASEARSSTTWGDLTTVGPTVTLDTDTQALVFHSCEMQNDIASAQIAASWSISGATTRDPVTHSALLEITAIISDGLNLGSSPWAFAGVDHIKSLTPGTNTFTAKYRVGTAGNNGHFKNRVLAVFPL